MENCVREKADKFSKELVFFLQPEFEAAQATDMENGLLVPMDSKV